MKTLRHVSQHALDQLRLRMPTSKLSQAEVLDAVVKLHWSKREEIIFKERPCWLVPIGNSLYAAVVEAVTAGRCAQTIATVLTLKQVDQNRKTGQWSGWFNDETTLKVTLGERLRKR